MPPRPFRTALLRRAFHLVPAGIALVSCLACRSASPSTTGPSDAPPPSAPTAATPPPSTAPPPPAASDTSGIRLPFRDDDPAFAFDPAQFTAKRDPRPGEWLDRFPETGVTFDEYTRMRVVTRTVERRVIVLQPLGSFSEREQEVLAHLREFMEVWFGTPTLLGSPLPLPDHGFRTRSEGGRTWRQYHTGTLLRGTLARRLPFEAVCYLGVTMADLYPDPKWNYVFGEATLEDRVGVYSLVRYFPAFWGKKDTAEARRLALLRAYKVMSHETGHMFSLPHCTRFECNMNGSNSLDELDAEPAHECHVCLKMLQWNLRFDIRQRYARLRDIYRRDGLEDQARWVDERLRKIGAAPESRVVPTRQ